MSDTDGSEFQMSSDDKLDSEDEARSNSDHGVVQLGARLAPSLFRQSKKNWERENISQTYYR